MLSSFGYIAGSGVRDRSDKYKFKTGDSMTAIVDLDANTISFQKNDAIIGKTHPIKHQEYYFAVTLFGNVGDCVTLVEIE